MSFPPSEEDTARAREALEEAFKVSDSTPSMHIASYDPNMAHNLKRIKELLDHVTFDRDCTIVTIEPNKFVSFLNTMSDQLGGAKHHIDRILERDKEERRPQVMIVDVAQPLYATKIHEAFRSKEMSIDIESAATTEFIRRLQEPAVTPVRLTESGGRAYGPATSNSNKAPKGPSRFHKSKSKRR